MSSILIIGGGYAGLWAALSACAIRDRESAADLRIRLVSDRAALTNRPRLYEGALPEMRTPLGPLMEEIGVDFTVAEVLRVTPRGVVLASGETLEADRVILAAGSTAAAPPIPGAAHGFVVDTHESTQALDAHLAALDMARDADRDVAVIGAGLTGIEIAATLRTRLGDAARITLADPAERPGAGLGAQIEAEIAAALDLARVAWVGGARLEGCGPDHVRLTTGRVAARTTIFATGFRASGLAAQLGPVRADGRLEVTPELRVAGAPSVFAAGDVALAMADAGRPTLMSCQHAMHTGRAAGRNAALELCGGAAAPYSQPYYATCVDLGPAGAVYTEGWSRDVILRGAEGARRKAQINTEWILPPDPARGRAARRAQALAA